LLNILYIYAYLSMKCDETDNEATGVGEAKRERWDIARVGNKRFSIDILLKPPNARINWYIAGQCGAHESAGKQVISPPGGEHKALVLLVLLTR
jgi:hypothetical protein